MVVVSHLFSLFKEKIWDGVIHHANHIVPFYGLVLTDSPFHILHNAVIISLRTFINVLIA